MTTDDLLAAHYNRYPSSQLKPYAKQLYQRAVWEEDKKAYFINVWQYDGQPEVLEASAELYLSGDRHMTLEIHHVEKMAIDEMEALFFAAWVKLGCIHDPHNN